MKSITRAGVKVDRVACPWLIKKFVEQEAEFIFVPPERVITEAERLGATPFDAPGVELGHHGRRNDFGNQGSQWIARPRQVRNRTICPSTLTGRTGRKTG